MPSALAFTFRTIFAIVAVAGVHVAMAAPASAASASAADASAVTADAAARPLPPDAALAREILAELISKVTTERTGITPAAEALAARFRAAGFPAEDVVLVGPSPKNQNLVVRLRGKQAKPAVGYFVHLDVVEALKEAWTVEPFVLLERDGYFYGRGTEDTKGTAAALVATLIRLKREGFVPRTDIVASFNSDEEGGPENGVDWLLKNRRDLIDVAYAINLDGDGSVYVGGQRARVGVSVGEKLYATYAFTFSNRGGHSSLPVPDNAIYRLSGALTRLSQYRFPVRLNDASRAMLKDFARHDHGPLAADMIAVAEGRADEAAIARVAQRPLLNALMRTTCVATQLQAGQAENALPMRAKGTVQCRLLPDEDVATMPKRLAEIAGDDQVEVSTVWQPIVAPASTLSAEVRRAVEHTTNAMWPGLPVMPIMAVGASDGTYLRGAGIPTYDVSGLFIDADDKRAHARDERIRVSSFYDAVEFQYRFMRALQTK
jgi:acetylornithine deacetylase/succinyl-diaminopimelate desuccinylase-like protein